MVKGDAKGQAFVLAFGAPFPPSSFPFVCSPFFVVMNGMGWCMDGRSGESQCVRT